MLLLGRYLRIGLSPESLFFFFGLGLFASAEPELSTPAGVSETLPLAPADGPSAGVWLG
jgi:hypothetical protein